MRTDAERIDWLEAKKQNVYTVYHERRRDRTTIEGGHDIERCFDGWTVGLDNPIGDTPREAIDAAMDAE